MLQLVPAAIATALLFQDPSGTLVEIGRFEDVRITESSGIAVSSRNPGVLWTHNDSGDGAYLYAVDTTGRALGRIRVTGATARDWEDVASGPCPDNLAEPCLYIADTGDNLLLRREVSVYAVRDPIPPVQETEPALVAHLRYPTGPRDVEALFVDAAATLHLISKGTSGSIDHYTVDRTAWQPETVTVARHVQQVGIRATRRRLVTGAAVSPAGDTVAIRSRRFLYIFDFADQRLSDEPRFICADDLPSGGEAVDFLSTSDLVLSYEADQPKAAPLYRLQCVESSSG